MIHQIITLEDSVLLAELIVVHAQLCLTEYTIHRVMHVFYKTNSARCKHTAYFSLLKHHKIKLDV